MKNKILSIILCMAMMMTMCPVMVSAEAISADQDTVTETSDTDVDAEGAASAEVEVEAEAEVEDAAAVLAEPVQLSETGDVPGETAQAASGDEDDAEYTYVGAEGFQDGGKYVILGALWPNNTFSGYAVTNNDSNCELTAVEKVSLYGGNGYENITASAVTDDMLWTAEVAETRGEIRVKLYNYNESTDSKMYMNYGSGTEIVLSEDESSASTWIYRPDGDHSTLRAIRPSDGRNYVVTIRYANKTGTYDIIAEYFGRGTDIKLYQQLSEDETSSPDVPEAIETSGSMIGFTSDIHDSITQLGGWLFNLPVRYALEYMVYGGDYSYATESEDYKKQFNLIKGESSDKLEGVESIYTAGNHEYGAKDQSQSEGPDEAMDPSVLEGVQVTGPAVEANDYAVYLFGATSGHQQFEMSEIDSLDAYLNDYPAGKPVFVVSHYPLHSTNGLVSKNAAYLLEKLNEHPNVIFVWGHYHNYENETLYGQVKKAGDTLTYDALNGLKKEINFTYLSAGAMFSGSGKYPYNGMVARVYGGNNVEFRYYGYDGIASDAVKIEIPEPSACSMTFDESATSGTVAVKVTTDEPATIFAAFYDNSGRIMSVSSQSVDQSVDQSAGEQTLTFDMSDLTAGETYTVRCMMTDSDSIPLAKEIEKKVTK